MSDITITKERIDRLMNTAEYDVITMYDKLTIVCAKLENGFVLTESSGCIDPANYDVKVGVALCKSKIRQKLWEMEGYALQKDLHKILKGD